MLRAGFNLHVLFTQMKRIFFVSEMPPQCRDDVSMNSLDPRRTSTVIEKEPSE